MGRLRGLPFVGPDEAGFLSGKYLVDGKLATTEEDKRLAPGSMGHTRYVGKPQDDEVVGRVAEVAKSKGVTPNQVALS